MSDRTVHASNSANEIVRYDRAGKWYLEPKVDLPRAHITLAQAVTFALDPSMSIHWGKPGGGAFEAKCKQRAR